MGGGVEGFRGGVGGGGELCPPPLDETLCYLLWQGLHC